MTTPRQVFESMAWGPAPESAALALEWLDGHGRRFGHFIGGSFIDPRGGRRFATLNPSTGAELARVAQGAPADVDRAVRAARKALPGWRALGGHGRALHLYALARGIQRKSRLLAVVESLDNGKPIRESRDIDLPLVARHFYHHAGWAELIESEFPEHRAIGVVGQIIPWNFPLLMLAWKVAPALATGNTVVLKPAEYTPLTALLFAEICTEVGLPGGVVNVVTGDGQTGDALVEHSGVDKIAFTGSTEVGRAIRVKTAGTGKRLSLELGGKSPFIVFDDSDLDSVVEGVVDAIWFNQGQVCCAGSRILAQEPIVAPLVAKLKERMERLRVGDSLDKAIDLGAIVAPVQLERIRALVDQGTKEGATLWQPSWSCPTDGLFYPPTLFTDVAPAATVAQVEIFGPVVVVMSFRTPAEAVTLANNTRYGLAASVWTENVGTALDIAMQVKAGTVWINCTNVFDAASGFGGYRESGFGREGGREGLIEYLEPVPSLSRGPGPRPRRSGRRPLARGSARADLPDRTYKLFIGGKQVRPDSGNSYSVGARGDGPGGRAWPAIDVPLGGRKDIRNAVEAARAASDSWAGVTGHQRAQVLYYLGENLASRADPLAKVMVANGLPTNAADREIAAAVRRAFQAAAWADKYDGQIHSTASRFLTLAIREPIGVMGLIAPETPSLLGFLTMVVNAVAMGNTVVAVPSERWPLAALDSCSVFETSDLPAGVINVVTGPTEELVSTLAAHDDVDGVWYFGSREGSALVERLSAGNLKQTWVDHGRSRDWADDRTAVGHDMVSHAVQVKNIWIAYGA